MKTIDELWKTAIYSILKYGQTVQSRLGESLEILGWRSELQSLDNTFLTNERRQLSLPYASAEVLWHLSGTDTIKMISAYAPQYKKFAEHGKAHGAYGSRRVSDPGLVNAGARCQLTEIIRMLKASGNNRRCVMTLWNGGDIVHAANNSRKDIPCTLTWQFIRRKKLHMICTMRSQDAWLGMPYDIYTNTCLQRVIAWTIGVEPGIYIHQVGSLHLYEKHYKRAKEAFSADVNVTSHNYKSRKVDFFEEAKKAVREEEAIRCGKQRIELDVNPVFQDCVQLCASKWIGINVMDIQSDLLRRQYVNSRR